MSPLSLSWCVRTLRRSALAVALTGLLVAAVSSPLAAQELETEYGLKAGIVTPGCIYVDDSDCIDGEVSYSVGGFLDYPLSPRLFGGLALDLHGVSAENSDDTETLLGVSLTLKADIPQDALTFRPGVGLGFGRVDFGQETSQHLTLQGLVDLVFPRPDMSFLVEVSVYASPAGGTDCCDVTFGPGGTLRAGIIF